MVTLFVIIILSMLGYFAAIKKISHIGKKITARKITFPINYYGYCALSWSFIASIIIISILSIFMNIQHENIIFCFCICLFLSVMFISPKINARNHFETLIKILLFLSAFLTISITFVIILVILSESIKFFSIISPVNFIFGLEWNPQMSVSDISNNFGFIPVLLGTILITIISLLVALPLGLYSAIYISEFSQKKYRTIIKPLMEILAGIPTIVYGYFATLIIAPLIRDCGDLLGLKVSSESALAAGVVIGIMITPFIMSLTDDVIRSVPKTLRDASLALGSTKTESIIKVVLPAAFPGIMGSILLAMSRAIGETMIVTMAAGLTAHFTLNPLDSVTTITAQIVMLLLGDQEFDDVKTLAAFALALILFFITLTLNIISFIIIKKYKNKYEI